MLAVIDTINVVCTWTRDVVVYILFGILQPLVDFILGRVINPLLIAIFGVIFVFAWSFFLGVVVIGFLSLGWSIKGKFPDWARMQLAEWRSGRREPRKAWSEPAPGSSGNEIPESLSQEMRRAMKIDGQSMSTGTTMDDKGISKKST